MRVDKKIKELKSDSNEAGRGMLMGNQGSLGRRDSGVSSLEKIIGGSKASIMADNIEYHLTLKSMPPCTEACPAHVNAKAYVNLIADGRYEEAYDAIFRSTPLPGVCGRVCTHPCEEDCALAETSPISIMELKRFAADFENIHKSSMPSHKSGIENRNAKQIAVIGAGPAGLTAAATLAQIGYAPTIFEAGKNAGGMLVQGIPEYRLPKKVLKREIDYLECIGVQIKTSTTIDTADQVFAEGYEAIILAAGAMKEIEIPVEGSEKEGVLGSLAFLRQVNSGELKRLSGRVVVLGGGSSAFDCARAAKRLGASEVTIAYRRTEAEMPAQREEVEEAIEEGIIIQTLAVPVRIVGDAKTTAIEFLKAGLGDEDESGRRRPIPIEGSEFVIEADRVIPAIGFEADIAGFSKDISLTRWGTVETDKFGRTSHNKIFAAGDVVLGPSTIIKAIASGHSAAQGVHAMLSRTKPTPAKAVEMPVIEGKTPITASRAKSRHSAPSERAGNFNEINLGLGEHKAVAEAARCLNCASCFECSKCLTTCDYKQIIGTLNGKSFIIKCPTELSQAVHEEPREWKLVVGEVENTICLESLTPEVDTDKCIGCGRCEDVCAYRAVRVRMRKGQQPGAVIEHDVCRSCGACTAVCPTGAITQGPMSQDSISKQINQHAMMDKPVAIESIWDSGSPFLSREKITLMCLRMVRPSMIIEAVASGEPALTISLSKDAQCHYLPPEQTLSQIVEATARLLKYAWTGNKEPVSGRGIPAGVASSGRNRLSRAYQDLKVFAHIDKLKEETVAHLAILASFLDAEGLPVLDGMVESVSKIIDTDIMDKSAGVASLDSLLDKVQIPSNPTPIKVGVLDRSGKGDAVRAQNILARLPGVELCAISFDEQLCLDNLNCKSRASAVQTLKGAETSGINFIAPLGLEELAVLRMYAREGAWQETSIKIIDIFTLLDFEVQGGEE